jgi:two-component system sensor histidine kinase DesK
MTHLSTATWARRGLRPWTLLVWLPLCYSLLIGPVTDAAPGHHSWPAWAVAALAAVAFTGAVLTRFRPGRVQRQAALLLLAGLTAAAAISTVGYSAAWSSLFVLAAIGVGVVMGGREAPYVVLLLTATATVAVLRGDGSSDDAFTAGLTVLLSGLGTYAFHQLFTVVAELNCTRDELARLAVSEERDRFARDLHDLLGHTLSVIVVKAEAVRRLAPRDSGAAVSHAADIESIGREALADVRRAAAGYRGAGLDRELGRARAALDAAGVSLAVEQRPQGDRPLPEPADALLGWVVREGVTNVVRHAQATRCTITVDRAGDTVRLRIDDDGGGGVAGATTGAGLRGLE